MTKTIFWLAISAFVASLASCAIASAAADEPLGKIPTCVPHEEAAQRLAAGGAVIIEEVTSPYPNGLLVFIHEGSIYAAGVDQNCVYSPSTFLGRVPTTKGTPA